MDKWVLKRMSATWARRVDVETERLRKLGYGMLDAYEHAKFNIGRRDDRAAAKWARQVLRKSAEVSHE